MFNLEDNEFWLGTEKSLEGYQRLLKDLPEQFTNYFAAKQKENKLVQANMQLDDFNDFNENSLDYYYSIMGDTAIIPITGNLVNATMALDFSRMLGLSTYANLAKAFHLAAENEKVSKVILTVQSGGGQVYGLDKATEALAYLKSKKPIASFIEYGHSAAYWLCSQGEHIVLSPYGSVGSIGVLMKRTSYQKWLQNAGIDSVVVRSAEKKALGQECEEITPEIKETFQKQADYLHQHFVNAVAKNRGLSADFVQSTMADGSVYYGNEAINRRFVNSLGTFTQLLSTWQPQSRSPSFYQLGSGLAASTGDQVMTLAQDSVLDSTQTETAKTTGNLAQPEANVLDLQTQLQNLTQANVQLEATNKVLAAAVANKEELCAELDQAKAECAALYKQSISSKANALNVEVFMCDDLVGLRALDAQLDSKFQAKFPSGGVAVTNLDANNDSDQSTMADWMKNIKTV